MLCAFELFQSTHVVKHCKYCSDLAPSLLCSAGMVAGFVSVSACASTIDSWQAVVIALVTVPLVANVRSICNQINRPECRGSAVDHFVGGCTSLMAAGIFARPGYVTEMNSASTGKPGGVAFGGNGTNLWVQLLALFTLVAWGMLGGAILAMLLSLFGCIHPSMVRPTPTVRTNVLCTRCYVSKRLHPTRKLSTFSDSVASVVYSKGRRSYERHAYIYMYISSTVLSAECCAAGSTTAGCIQRRGC
jgi:Ammonium Transporter Family